MSLYACPLHPGFAYKDPGDYSCQIQTCSAALEEFVPRSVADDLAEAASRAAAFNSPDPSRVVGSHLQDRLYALAEAADAYREATHG